MALTRPHVLDHVISTCARRSERIGCGYIRTAGPDRSDANWWGLVLASDQCTNKAGSI